MTDQKKTTTTTTTTKVNVREALDRSVLTAEEERVLRMRRGLTEKPSARLQLKGQDDPEVRAKLAMIEQMALAALRGGEPPKPVATATTSRKAQIIERLRRERRRE